MPFLKLSKLEVHVTIFIYCGWLKFHGVTIFVVFVEGLIHKFQYSRNGNFLYELWKKILWPRILNPTNVSFFINLRKLVLMKIKPSTVCNWDYDLEQDHNNATFECILMKVGLHVIHEKGLIQLNIKCQLTSKSCVNKRLQGMPHLGALFLLHVTSAVISVRIYLP